MDDKFLYEFRQEPQLEFAKALFEKINKEASAPSAINSLCSISPTLASISIFWDKTVLNIIQTLPIKPIKQLEITISKWLGFLLALILSITFIANGALAFIHMISGFIPSNLIAVISLMILSIIEGIGLDIFTSKLLGLGFYGITFIYSCIGQISTILNNLLTQCTNFAATLFPSESICQLITYKIPILNTVHCIFAYITVALGILLLLTIRKQNFIPNPH